MKPDFFEQHENAGSATSLMQRAVEIDLEKFNQNQATEDKLRILHKYQRDYKKVCAGLIRTPEMMPTENDIKIMQAILVMIRKFD